MTGAVDPRVVGPRIRMMLPDMSPSEARITGFLMRHKFDETLPLKHVAEVSGTSEAMVVKTAKKLGFYGFRELRAAVVEYKRQSTVGANDELQPDDTAETIAKKVFQTSIQALEETLAILDTAALEKAVKLIHGARQRDFYGLGGSAQIARDAANRFLRIGVRASVFDDTHMMAVSASLLGPGDLVIAYSHSGRSSAIVDAVQFARAGGAAVIAVTNYDSGPLVDLSDVVLCSTGQGSTMNGETAAARIAQLSLMDAVFVAVAQRSYPEAERNLARTASAVRTRRR